MALNDVLATLKAAGARFYIDVSPDEGNPWRANLQDAEGNALVENAALADLAAVEAFFRTQGRVYYPNVVLP